MGLGDKDYLRSFAILVSLSLGGGGGGGAIGTFIIEIPTREGDFIGIYYTESSSHGL